MCVAQFIIAGVDGHGNSIAPSVGGLLWCIVVFLSRWTWWIYIWLSFLNFFLFDLIFNQFLLIVLFSLFNYFFFHLLSSFLSINFFNALLMGGMTVQQHLSAGLLSTRQMLIIFLLLFPPKNLNFLLPDLSFSLKLLTLRQTNQLSAFVDSLFRPVVVLVCLYIVRSVHY